jgi:hypothetical protein
VLAGRRDTAAFPAIGQRSSQGRCGIDTCRNHGRTSRRMHVCSLIAVKPKGDSWQIDRSACGKSVQAI